MPQAKIDQANGYDLVIVERDTNSGNDDDGGEVGLWNSIISLMVCRNGYPIQALSFLWF